MYARPSSQLFAGHWGTAINCVSCHGQGCQFSIIPTMTELRNASGDTMRLLGEAQVVMCNDKHSAQSTVLVTADLNHAALIGWQDLQKLRVIPALFPAVAAVAQCFKDIKTKTLNSFPHVFSDTLDDKPMCAQKNAHPFEGELHTL